VPPKYEATIRRTTDGVPHISGARIVDAAYGQGWVSGEDHGCTLIDQVFKVTSTRSANLGPGADGENVDSDFAWRAIDLATIAATDFARAPDDIVELFDAYTAGWNDHLAEVGRDGIAGWCTGADWLRPLTPVEVYTYARSITLLASSEKLVDYLGSAQPPAETPPSGIGRPEGFDLWNVPDLGLGAGSDRGSNGWAIGRERTAGGSGGLLLANPHFPWEGELRFSEAHLIVPGQYDIYGANLLGVPGIGIGFTDGVAWTHTVSDGKRMTLYDLTLDPESATSYLVDGVSTPLTSSQASVDILRADGSVDTETRTLWRSEYGPIIDFPGVGWTDGNVLTYRDANLDNDEFIEQYARLAEVRSIADLEALNAQYQGQPLFNTVATDADGNVWYADASATPNLSDEAQLAFLNQLFTEPIIKFVYDQGAVLLDGSDSRFRWVDEPGARDPGLVAYADMPRVERTDYVFNANDSYWIPNVEAPLTGAYSFLHGTRNTPLSMRTRQNAAVLGAANEAGLAGPDGLFDADEVRTAALENSGRTAGLLLAAAVAACTAEPIVEVDDAPVDLTEACRVLAGWDGVYDLDRSGPIIWRETMTRFDVAAFEGAGPLFADAFDPTDPTRTPRVPAPDTAPLLEAMGRAVRTIAAAGFALDTTLGAVQFSERSETRVPIHGGVADDGVTNVVQWSDVAATGEPLPERGAVVTEGSSLRDEGYRVNSGTSFIMTVDFTGDLPEAWAILVYGESGDRTSPVFDSQMVRFSEKNWRKVALTDEQIDSDPDLVTSTVVGR
jgi:acyl-homoserine-lactone acylase